MVTMMYLLPAHIAAGLKGPTKFTPTSGMVLGVGSAGAAGAASALAQWVGPSSGIRTHSWEYLITSFRLVGHHKPLLLVVASLA